MCREDTQLIFIDPEDGRLKYSNCQDIDTFGCEVCGLPALSLDTLYGSLLSCTPQYGTAVLTADRGNM